MSNFVERVKECIKDAQINRLELSQKIGVAYSVVHRYVSGQSEPSFENFVKILYLFDSSADYLLGVEEIHTSERLYPVEDFKQRLRAVMKERKISQEKLKNDLSVSSSVIYKWVSGKSKPSTQTLIMLAKYFDCSVDYLIGRRK